jgi:two-component system response regulator HydG
MHARLTLEAGDCRPATLDLTPEQPATIGRGRDNSVVLRDSLASRLHAKVYWEGGHWFVRDFGLNGTRLDDERITGGAELTDGRLLRIGDVALRFSALAGSGTVDALVPGAPETLHTYRPRGENHQTKAVEHPMSRRPADPPQEVADRQRRMDDLTALCKYMSAAVELKSPHELIEAALRTILNQTAARLTGYLSFDPNEPEPKLVLPEDASVDATLSRRLTQQAFTTGTTVWMFPDLTSKHSPTDSLSMYADAVCIPLKASGEIVAALHAYRTGRTFQERDVRFMEAVAGFLAHGLEIHRTRRKLEAENSRLRTHAPVADEIIGESAAMTHLRQQIVRAAPQSLTVLVQGESGSGKELVAFALHKNSRRSSGPLVVVNCANLSPATFDFELFGNGDHIGFFRQADEGTLFFDEISDLSLECQAKILRVIEGKSFRPVGANREVTTDVRIVAATNRDLEAEVRAGRFRADLYFRLCVITLRVPPLRERLDDVPELASVFLLKVATECRRNFRLAPAAVDKLQNYDWPGNVRQLRAAIESAAVMSDTDLLDAESIPLPESPDVDADSASLSGYGLPPSLNVDDIETWAIHRALRQTGGNVSHASKLLGMSRDTLHTKIKKKAIDRDALVNTPEPAALTMS